MKLKIPCLLLAYLLASNPALADGCDSGWCGTSSVTQWEPLKSGDSIKQGDFFRITSLSQGAQVGENPGRAIFQNGRTVPPGQLNHRQSFCTITYQPGTLSLGFSGVVTDSRVDCNFDPIGQCAHRMELAAVPGSKPSRGSKISCEYPTQEGSSPYAKFSATALQEVFGGGSLQVRHTNFLQEVDVLNATNENGYESSIHAQATSRSVKILSLESNQTGSVNEAEDAHAGSAK